MIVTIMVVIGIPMIGGDIAVLTLAGHLTRILRSSCGFAVHLPGIASDTDTKRAPIHPKNWFDVT
jgi:hypothetical protein